MIRHDWRVVLLLAELDLGAEAGSGHAHLDSGLAHAIKGIAAGFGRWAFVDQVAEDRCSSEDGKIDVIEGLQVLC